jgi:hypothetical protein
LDFDVGARAAFEHVVAGPAEEDVVAVAAAEDVVAVAADQNDSVEAVEPAPGAANARPGPRLPGRVRRSWELASRAAAGGRSVLGYRDMGPRLAGV